MKSIFSTLSGLAVASVLALAFTVSTPRPAFADNTATVDNQFNDGNWFKIATTNGEEYKTGSPTQVALQTQIDAYQSAVDNKDNKAEEHFAIRSWVKSLCASALAADAYDAGKYAEALSDVKRAIREAKTAQQPGAGLGEPSTRVDTNAAQTYGGTSKIEGARAQEQAEALLA